MLVRVFLLKKGLIGFSCIRDANLTRVMVLAAAEELERVAFGRGQGRCGGVGRQVKERQHRRKNDSSGAFLQVVWRPLAGDYADEARGVDRPVAGLLESCRKDSKGARQLGSRLRDRPHSRRRPRRVSLRLSLAQGGSQPFQEAEERGRNHPARGRPHQCPQRRHLQPLSRFHWSQFPVPTGQLVGPRTRP